MELDVHGSAWMRKELLTELRRHKNEFYKRWKKGQVTQEECRVAVWSCRDRLRTAKVDLELNLGRGLKSNKGFYKYLSSKRETGANVGPLLNGPGELVTNDMEKAKVLSAAFTSGFASKTSLQESLAPETQGKVFSLLSVLSFLTVLVGQHPRYLTLSLFPSPCCKHQPAPTRSKCQQWMHITFPWLFLAGLADWKRPVQIARMCLLHGCRHEHRA